MKLNICFVFKLTPKRKIKYGVKKKLNKEVLKMKTTNQTMFGEFNFDSNELMFYVRGNEEKITPIYRVLNWTRKQPLRNKIPELCEKTLVEPLYGMYSKWRHIEFLSLGIQLLKQATTPKEKHLIAILTNVGLSLLTDKVAKQKVMNEYTFRFHYIMTVIDLVLKYYQYKKPTLVYSQFTIKENGKSESFLAGKSFHIGKLRHYIVTAYDNTK